MGKDSTPTRGSEIIRQAARRKQEEREAAEAEMEMRFRQLLDSFTRRWNGALGTMQADMDRVTTSVQRRVRTLSLVLLLAVLLPLGALTVGTASWLQWQTGRIMEADRILAERRTAIRELGTGILTTLADREWRYVVTSPATPEPEVYQNDHYPGSWIIKLKK